MISIKNFMTNILPKFLSLFGGYIWIIMGALMITDIKDGKNGQKTIIDWYKNNLDTAKAFAAIFILYGISGFWIVFAPVTITENTNNIFKKNKVVMISTLVSSAVWIAYGITMLIDNNNFDKLSSWYDNKVISGVLAGVYIIIGIISMYTTSTILCPEEEGGIVDSHRELGQLRTQEEKDCFPKCD